MGQGMRVPAAPRIGRFFGVRRSGATKSVSRNRAREVERESERMQMREKVGIDERPRYYQPVIICLVPVN